MRILIAIDDSEFSRAVVETVANRTERKEVRVLHVLAPVTPLMGEMGAQIGDTSALEQTNQLAQGKALVDEAAQRLRAAHLNVSTAIEEGEPKSKILDHAEQCGCALGHSVGVSSRSKRPVWAAMGESRGCS